MEHHEFLKVIHQMDLGLQVSYTESFNIVTADFVHCEKPIIVGHDTDWMYCESKVDANNIPMMVEKIENVMKNPSKYILRNYTSFEKYYRKSLRIWRWFLGV
jgi:hypothetical protein